MVNVWLVLGKPDKESTAMTAAAMMTCLVDIIFSLTCQHLLISTNTKCSDDGAV